jgi:hypothetical protein
MKLRNISDTPYYKTSVSEAKSLLEASAFGLFKMEEVFFGFMQVALPDGKKVSTIDLLSQYQHGKLLLTSGEDNG